MYYINYRDVYYLMKFNKYSGIIPAIIIALMLTTTIATGQLNMLQINNANAQNQAGPNNSPPPTQGLNTPQMNNGPNPNLNPYSTTTPASNPTGSISIFSPIINGFKASIHASLTDAITTAENSIGNNSTTVAAFIHPDKGSIIYDIFALDSNNNVHKVIVDPGNGKILSSEQMSIIEMMMLLHGGGDGMGMGPGMMTNHGMGMGPGMMTNHGMGMGPGMMTNHGMGMGPGTK